MTKVSAITAIQDIPGIRIDFSNDYHYHITFDDVIFATDLAFKLKTIVAQIFKDVEEGIL